MAFAKVVSWFSQGLFSLAPPYWGKRNIAALLFSFALEIQEIEDTLFDIREKRKIANATGAQLATLGALVGQPRYTFTDEGWRAAIRARTRINRSRGLRTDIVEVIRAIYGAGVAFAISRAHPAGFFVAIRNFTDFPPQIAHAMMTDAAAAGVQVVFTSYTEGLGVQRLRLGSVNVAAPGQGVLTSRNVTIANISFISRVIV